MGLYESCEIIRLTNADPKLRDAAEQVRELLLKLTRSPHNLLAHEKKPVSAKKALSPLLPRLDA